MNASRIEARGSQRMGRPHYRCRGAVRGAAAVPTTPVAVVVAAAQATASSSAAPATTTAAAYNTSSSNATSSSSSSAASRRSVLTAFAAAAALAIIPPPPAASAAVTDATEVEAAAYRAYAERRFSDAVALLDTIADLSDARWLEMRAQVLVDGKDFGGALRDYGAALKLAEEGGAPLTARARLLAGRALAKEGLSDWASALADYDAALELAAAGGESVDPFVLNARGNCYNSLGRWREARGDYLAAADIFQASRGFRGRNGGTTDRLDGAVFAASNAALMLAELGDVGGAEAEMRRVARRAPGSADMRVALAALLWRRGDEAAAEENWEWACNAINVGCRKYTDEKWVTTVRRWPPTMAAALADFLALRRGAAAGGSGTAAVLT